EVHDLLGQLGRLEPEHDPRDVRQRNLLRTDRDSTRVDCNKGAVPGKGRRGVAEPRGPFRWGRASAEGGRTGSPALSRRPRRVVATGGTILAGASVAYPRASGFSTGAGGRSERRRGEPA